MSEEKDWVKETLKSIEKIKNWKVDDRLSLVSKLTYMNAALAGSVAGWNSWLTNATVMERFNKEELDKLSEAFEKLTIDFLQLDIKYTMMMQQKLKEPEEEPSKKTVYVA
jgi:hypothetical protein